MRLESPFFSRITIFSLLLSSFFSPTLLSPGGQGKPSDPAQSFFSPPQAIASRNLNVFFFSFF